MAQKKTRLGQAADLRRLAEEIARKNATQSPDNLEAMSPETIRQTLHELRVYQIELEMQNEELRQAHAVLDALHTRYFDLYDLAPVGYCTVSEKGLILEANLTAATMLGVTRNGLVKQPISLFILNKDQDIYYRHRKLLFATGKPQMCEVRMLRRDATPFCVRLDATVPQGGKGESMSRVVISDITERQQAEEKLRDSEKQYRTLFEAIADAVFLIDQETGHLLDVNPAATRMYGFNREEFLQMTAMDVSAEFEKTASAVSKPVPFIPLRNHRHKDGSVFPVELTASIFELEGRKTIIMSTDSKFKGGMLSFWTQNVREVMV